MQLLTKSQKARNAVRTIKTTVDALALRGYYKPSGKSGQTLSGALRNLSPEIYGSMNDPRIIELKGLEYVVERLPKGIEACNRIILTAQEEFENTSFEKIIPPKRRRASYRIGDKEICFIITRGLSEIYDILTHVTFLNNEATKIFHQMKDRDGNMTREWKQLDKIVSTRAVLSGDELDKTLWNLSIILGRTLQETRETYQYLEGNCDEGMSHLFLHLIYGLGKRVEEEAQSRENELLITFTPSLQDMIGNQSYSRKWAGSIKRELMELGFQDRPLHIISANLHSVMNLLYGYDAVSRTGTVSSSSDLYDFILRIRGGQESVQSFAVKNGLHSLPDNSGSNIDCQIIDTAMLEDVTLHPELSFNPQTMKHEKPVLLVMDYAFGTQAFEAMDELLEPYEGNSGEVKFDIRSVSVMGKAGILTGDKGDIMLASAHVFEGTSDNYPVDNDLSEDDFQGDASVFTGPIITVVGTSLQNRDLLKRFHTTSWKAIGLEMEGGHYQKAVSSAIIRGHISGSVKTRYAYYASDNPLVSGQTLASGSMGEEGVRPTYMITKVILDKILG